MRDTVEVKYRKVNIVRFH